MGIARGPPPRHRGVRRDHRAHGRLPLRGRVLTRTELASAALLDDDGLAQARCASEAICRESVDPDDPDRFIGDGVVGGWVRRLTVAPDPAGAPDRHLVTQYVAYDLEVPLFGWLFGRPIRREAARVPLRRTPPWWAPPDALDARGAQAIAALAILSMLCGYLGTLITQTIAFAGKEFGVGRSDQSYLLALIRVDAAIALGVVAIADRVGRRPVLVYAAYAATAFTVVGALAPTMPALLVLQVPARGLTAAVAITIGVVAAEEVPAGARAWTASVLALIAGFGGFLCVLVLPFADVGRRGWRISFVAPVLFVPLLVKAMGTLRESRRFAREERLEQAGVKARPSLRGHLPRLVLLAIGGALTVVFLTPAGQLQNTFLADERGFSASRITLYSILTGTPGGLGVVLGGRWADRHGRRGIAVAGTLVGTALFLVSFLVPGWPMWAAASVAGLAGGAIIPALSVYGPELFPTALRGKANGVISTTARGGSVVGLLLAGYLSDRLGGLGPALAILAVGPAILCVLILTLYPETASKELEELNPEDRGLL